MKLDHLAKSEILNFNPLIVTIDNFVSDDDCNALIEAAKPAIRKTTVYTEGKGPEQSDSRTNSACLLDPAEHSQAKAMVTNVGNLVRIPRERAEGVTVMHYSEKQRFDPHFDGFSTHGTERHKMILEKGGGQRLYTSICYLNEGFSGGLTHFPRASITVVPKKGMLLLFANTKAGSREPSPASLHAGAAVKTGEKWVATIWWREHEFSYELLRAINAGEEVVL